MQATNLQIKDELEKEQSQHHHKQHYDTRKDTLFLLIPKNIQVCIN